jgi:hypothetical protein
VLEGESGGTLTVTGNDQRRNLDDLTLTPRRGTNVLLCLRDVFLRAGPVATGRGHDREQGLLDRVHRKCLMPAE